MSILSSLKRDGSLEAYWVNTGSTSMIEKLLDEYKEQIAPKIVALMEKQEIIEPIDKYLAFDIMADSESALWGLLLFSGHLSATVENTTMSGLYNCKLKIPNQELFTVFYRHYAKWFKNELKDDYKYFLDSLITGDTTTFSQQLNQYLLQTISIRDTARYTENFYHGLVLGLIASLCDTTL